MNESLIAKLNELIDYNLDPALIPYKKGNSIRIGHIVVRKNKRGYVLFDCTANKMLNCMYSKVAAIALAKNHAMDRKQQESIIELDTVIKKNSIDAQFFEHTVYTSKNPIRIDIASVRLDIAEEKVIDAHDRLENYIFD